MRRLAGSGAVVAIDRRGPEELVDRAQYLRCDLLDGGWESLVKFGSVVVHLAGASGTRDATAEMCRRDNVEATARVAEVAAAAGARLIIASSSSVYGGAPPNRESDVCAPLNHYGESKLEAERRALEITGGSALALRFFTVYGPGQRANMLFSRAIAAAETGEALTVHDPDATRDFTYVGDVVRAIELAIATPPASGPMNIGAGETHSVGEVLEMFEQVLGRQISTVAGDAGVVEPDRTEADVTRAAEILGFRTRVSLAEGIELQVGADSASPRHDAKAGLLPYIAAFTD